MLHTDRGHEGNPAATREREREKGGEGERERRRKAKENDGYDNVGDAKRGGKARGGERDRQREVYTEKDFWLRSSGVELPTWWVGSSLDGRCWPYDARKAINRGKAARAKYRTEWTRARLM